MPERGSRAASWRRRWRSGPALLEPVPGLGHHVQRPVRPLVVRDDQKDVRRAFLRPGLGEAGFGLRGRRGPTSAITRPSRQRPFAASPHGRPRFRVTRKRSLELKGHCPGHLAGAVCLFRTVPSSGRRIGFGEGPTELSCVRSYRNTPLNPRPRSCEGVPTLSGLITNTGATVPVGSVDRNRTVQSSYPVQATTKALDNRSLDSGEFI
jgi:hypothetical protein